MHHTSWQSSVEHTLSHITDVLDIIMVRHPHLGIVLCGDFNQLNDRSIVNYPLRQIVGIATTQNNVLDKIYTNISHAYVTLAVLPSVGTSDHNVVIMQAVSNVRPK